MPRAETNHKNLSLISNEFFAFSTALLTSSFVPKEIFANGRLTDLNDNLHQEKLSEIRKVASTLNMTIEDLALIWVYQLPFVKIVLTGASTIDQLDKNINSLNKIDIELPSLSNYQLSQTDYWNTRKSLSWN